MAKTNKTKSYPGDRLIRPASRGAMWILASTRVTMVNMVHTLLSSGNIRGVKLYEQPKP